MTLDKILTNRCSKYPNKKALDFDSSKYKKQRKKNYKYKEVNKYANKLSSGLKGLGIGKNSKVAIVLKNCPEFIISYFGILKAEAITVPVNYMFKEEEIKYVLENSDCSTVITSSEFSEIIKRIRLRVENLRHIVVIGSNVENTIPFSEIMESKAEKEPLNVEADDIASIIYTSGTTGKPKGVMLTHKNFYSNIKSSTQAVKITYKDKFLCFLPMFHSFTWTVCVLIPLFAGCTIYILDSVRPFRKIIKKIFLKRISIFIAIPPVYNILSKISVPKLLRIFLWKFFNPLRICVSGASSLPLGVIENFEKKFKIPLLEGYGLTEASPVVSINPVEKRKIGSVGKPLAGVKVKIVNEQGKKVSPNSTGELLVKGDNIMKGYYKKKDETNEALKKDWLYTGDIAKRDNEGYIYIIDRKTDMIIIRGQNVFPKEIEEVLYHNSKIAEAAIVGVKDKFKGEVPKAYISLKEGEEVSEKEIIRFLRPRIASYKLPKVIEFKDSLPKTPTGKIQKYKLK